MSNNCTPNSTKKRTKTLFSRTMSIQKKRAEQNQAAHIPGSTTTGRSDGFWWTLATILDQEKELYFLLFCNNENYVDIKINKIKPDLTKDQRYDEMLTKMSARTQALASMTYRKVKTLERLCSRCFFLGMGFFSFIDSPNLKRTFVYISCISDPVGPFWDAPLQTVCLAGTHLWPGAH